MTISQPVTAAALLLKIAGSYSWVREKGGQNRGEAVAHFLETVNLHDPEPWCAAFVSTVGIDAFGAEWPLPRVAGCASLGDAAKKKGLLYDFPVPGAVFLLWSEGKRRFHHTGFVGDPVDGKQEAWHTVEGNSNNTGSAEGIGVFKNIRRFDPLDRYIWWWA